MRTDNVTKRIAIIHGHPDPSGNHLLHAMSNAYADAAASAGHDVRRIEVAQLAFPLLRTQQDFEAGALPPALVQPSEDLRWAQHWVFLFPLWHGTMPALFKGFLEQVFRPGFAMEYNPKGFPKRLLAGIARPASLSPWACRRRCTAGTLEPTACAASSAAC
jgi:putative NADPH-quinone reductase